MRGEGAADAADLWTGSRVDIELQLVNARVLAVGRGPGSWLRRASSGRVQCQAGPRRRPRELRALKPFMILVTLFSEWARGGGAALGQAPPRSYKCGFPGSLWDPELGGERELGLHCLRRWQRGKADRRLPSTGSRLPEALLCAPVILIRDAVTIFF